MAGNAARRTRGRDRAGRRRERRQQSGGKLRSVPLPRRSREHPCPITTTRSSCCISQPCAIAMASTMVAFANSISAGMSARLRAVSARHLALPDEMARGLGEQMIEHGIGRGLRALQIVVHRRVDLAGAFLDHACSSASLQAPALTRYSRKRIKGSSAQAALTSSGRR